MSIGSPPASTSELADRLITRVIALCDRLEIPSRLAPLGVTKEMLAELVRGSHGNSLSGNPRDLSDGKLTEILEAML